MSNEGIALLAVLAVALVIYFRRELLQLLVLLGAILCLTFIWSSEIQAAWLKGGLSVVLLFIVGVLVKKFKLDENTGSTPSKRWQSGQTYKPTCTTCNGTGKRYCFACSGSGQGPGGLGNSLGKPVSCFHCSGSGYIRCGCKS